MAVSRDEIVAVLRQDEPDYASAGAAFGAEAAPVLVDLVAGADLELASKAASMAAYLGPDAARPVLSTAADHASTVVRATAAASLASHPALAGELASALLEDADANVRNWTLRALESTKPPGFKEKVQTLIADESLPALRNLAASVAQQLP